MNDCPVSEAWSMVSLAAQKSAGQDTDTGMCKAGLSRKAAPKGAMRGSIHGLLAVHGGERRKSTDVHAFYILEIIFGQVYHQENYLTISSNHQKLKEIYPSFYIYNLKLSSIPGMKTKTIYIYIPIYLLFHLLINILYFYLVR